MVSIIDTTTMPSCMLDIEKINLSLNIKDKSGDVIEKKNAVFYSRSTVVSVLRNNDLLPKTIKLFESRVELSPDLSLDYVLTTNKKRFISSGSFEAEPHIYITGNTIHINNYKKINSIHYKKGNDVYVKEGKLYIGDTKNISEIMINGIRVDMPGNLVKESDAQLESDKIKDTIGEEFVPSCWDIESECDQYIKDKLMEEILDPKNESTRIRSFSVSDFVSDILDDPPKKIQREQQTLLMPNEELDKPKDFEGEMFNDAKLARALFK